MNKQELIKSYENARFGIFSVDKVLEDLRQLDESQKVTVPQFVADYIKYAIENDWDFQDLFKCIEDEEDEELTRWVYHERNQETLAAAWINGYEVEKEKRYLVKMKNLRALFCYLAYIPDEGYWALMASGGKSIVIKHTRKQLEEAGFGWVFDCEGMEVEEV
ncbi:DUF1642 domain-containing protein [Streptococcus parasanguinis]|uniref:DUF1642 domain-containing protein n=1 Tax=Streptococcus parasanguinis TaxID=1318 RepID=UPI0007795EF6|nr:DUF1642 domain-containing protein [Streptococcus parasanguinis]